MNYYNYKRCVTIITILLILGEAAVSLGRREDLIKRTVEWCSIEDHPGVQGEANRLIAWLINNSRCVFLVTLLKAISQIVCTPFRDKQIALSIIKYGAVQHLVKMLLAKHALMQNEAIMGLTVLTRICPTESEELLIKANFGRSMREFFEARANNLDVHIVLNALTLLDSVVRLGIRKIHLKILERRIGNFVLAQTG